MTTQTTAAHSFASDDAAMYQTRNVAAKWPAVLRQDVQDRIDAAIRYRVENGASEYAIRLESLREFTDHENDVLRAALNGK